MLLINHRFLFSFVYEPRSGSVPAAVGRSAGELRISDGVTVAGGSVSAVGAAVFPLFTSRVAAFPGRDAPKRDPPGFPRLPTVSE